MEMVSASSTYDPRYVAANALDGRTDTRWASRTFAHEPEWLQIDLGQFVGPSELTIHWERAYAKKYHILVSGDGKRWKKVVDVQDGSGGKPTHRLDEKKFRYLRILCIEPGLFSVFSIWEITSGTRSLGRALMEARERLKTLAEKEAREQGARATKALIERGIQEIIFAVRKPGVDGHWYANFGYYARSRDEFCYQPGSSGLFRLDLSAGELHPILEDEKGCLRDPQLHYDAKKLVFSYLEGGTRHFHLHEIGLHGQELRQLTEGDCDDIEPTYLPDGGVAFCSSRCYRWVNCWLTPVAILYRCEADGSHVRMLSANVEHDNTPWPMPDGRILYTRWEYVDRSQVHYHHLWSMNPDGTGQMTFFGNMHPGIVMIDAKPIPDTGKVAALFSPGHGRREHEGPLRVVDPKQGPDHLASAFPVEGSDNLRDPYPIAEDFFLAASGAEIVVIGEDGKVGRLFRLSRDDIAKGLWCHEPQPVAARSREPVIPSRVNMEAGTGCLILSDIYEGRNMAGVERGEIKRLLVLEPLPKPINYTGGMDPMSWGGTFTLERVLGTVPVAEDGSAYFELPALRNFFFVALDEKGESVKRMQSFLTVQPGEMVGCVGCHESRTQTPLSSRELAAMGCPPSQVEPLDLEHDVMDFPRDVQPVLDKHCVRCHDYAAHEGGLGPRAGGVILSGDRGPMFSHSYAALTLRKQFVDGRNDPVSNLAPRAIGSSASPLLSKLEGGHHDVIADERDRLTVRLWIDSGASYPGTYGALGCGSIGGYYANQETELDTAWPETKKASQFMMSTCAKCHQGDARLPMALCDERGVSFWRPDWSDPCLPYCRHLVFNLSRPEMSLVLLAPLSQGVGGYATRESNQEGEGHPIVFREKSDERYQAILEMCLAGRERLDTIKRFDMPGFRPPEPYLREMVRNGTLSDMPPEGEPVDCYALDRDYWRSFWYLPGGS